MKNIYNSKIENEITKQFIKKIIIAPISAICGHLS
jgi:hypothetical protein